MKFTKKPVTIEAVQWRGRVADFEEFGGGPLPITLAPLPAITINTLEGDMRAEPDDWIIRGVKGEFYPCKPDIFEATYSPASAPPSQGLAKCDGRDVTTCPHPTQCEMAGKCIQQAGEVLPPNRSIEPYKLPDGVTPASMVDYLRAMARAYAKDLNAPDFPIETTAEWIIADWIELREQVEMERAFGVRNPTESVQDPVDTAVAALQRIASATPIDHGEGTTSYRYRCRACQYAWGEFKGHTEEHHAEDCAYIIARDALDGTTLVQFRSSGAEAIAAERQRQTEAEGWTPEHDDEHDKGEMLGAAASYTLLARQQAMMEGEFQHCAPPIYWPWHSSWWKPRDVRQNLVRAGALIAAEIDRLDRIPANIARLGGRTAEGEGA